jgi:death-on-curing protein
VIEPIWITAEEAVAANRFLVAQFGGLDAGVRDVNLLHAAIARPLNKWHYETPKPTLFVLAAAYAYGIAKGHVFHDGNRRTAYLMAVTFLELNGHICAPDQQDLVTTMVAVAAGRMSEGNLARWFAANAVKAGRLSEGKPGPFRNRRRRSATLARQDSPPQLKARHKQLRRA